MPGGGRCRGWGSPEPLLPSPPPGTSIVFDMSLTYILVALVAVLLNNALVERLSLHTRITAGALPAAHPAPGPHTCPSHALHSLRAPHSPCL